MYIDPNRKARFFYDMIIEKAREIQKNIYFFLIDYTKAFDSVDHNKLWKILKEIRIPDPPDLPLENLYCRSGSNS